MSTPDILETLAKALWEIVPYDRGIKWDDHNETTKWHYRTRAASLLEKFDIGPRHPYTPPIIDLTDDDAYERAEKQILIYGHAVVRVTAPKAGSGYEYFGV